MHHNKQYEEPNPVTGRTTSSTSAGVKSTPTKSRPLSKTRMATRDLVLAALFGAITSVLAYVRIPLPFSPVPITGQTFGVMLAGVLLGPRLGALSMVVYVLMGVAGLPVFSGGTAGIGVLVGPTGGYLWGCIAGAYVTGLVTADRGPLSVAKASSATVLGGIVAVYGIGVLQLAIVSGLSLYEALAAGVVPFLLGDAIKAATAAALAVRLQPLVRSLGR